MGRVSVRTAYPNVFAEAAETTGLQVFQRVTEIDLYGGTLDGDALASLAELPELKKLVVTHSQICRDGLTHFRQVRPDVQLQVTPRISLAADSFPLVTPAGPASASTPSFDGMVSCSVSPAK